MDVESRPVIVSKWEDNPLTTYAQTMHEIETGVAAPGRIQVIKNLTTLMGGFCRFRGEAHQNMAAARYKALHDASQLGGGKACDPAVEPVDGGSVNPEAIFEIGADARKLYFAINEHLGKMDARRFHFVVVMERGPTAYAKWRYNEARPDGRTVGRGQVEVRGIADRLAKYLKLAA